MRESPLPLAPLFGDVLPAGSRLVTGIVILALSLAIGLRGARDQPAVEAVPQPVLQRFIVGTPLPPLEPAAVLAPQASGAERTASRTAEVTRATHAEAPRRFASRHLLRHRATALGTPRLVLSHYRPAARINRSDVVARTGFPRSREQVRREYLRSRDVVAALTGEDSGSVYLTRAAARQRSARFVATHHLARRHTIRVNRYQQSPLKT